MSSAASGELSSEILMSNLSPHLKGPLAKIISDEFRNTAICLPISNSKNCSTPAVRIADGGYVDNTGICAAIFEQQQQNIKNIKVLSFINSGGPLFASDSQNIGDMYTNLFVNS